MYHFIYIMTMPWFSQHCLFNGTYMLLCSVQQTVCSSKHCG